MAISVKIDFDDVFEITPVLKDFKIITFNTELVNNELETLKVEISNNEHPLLKNVYNLAFGPMDSKGLIDDKAQLVHKDYSKVFSTILVHALSYLKANKDHYLGIDGSSNGRAFLYFKFIQRNYDYLNRYFRIYGLKYYVRITRFGKTQYENPFDFEDISHYPSRLVKGIKIENGMMYNYFIFNLK